MDKEFADRIVRETSLWVGETEFPLGSARNYQVGDSHTYSWADLAVGWRMGDPLQVRLES